MAHKDICHALLGFPLEDVVVFDTETTGVDSRNDELLSIAIINGLGKVLYRSFVRPRFHRSWPSAERVNHISPSMVATAPTIRECADEIRRYINSSHLVVGYNVSFDIGFLVNAGVIDWADVPNVFDVMREFAKVHGLKRYGSGNYRYSKLAWCARYYGYSFSAHDALEDSKATAYCLRSLLLDGDYNRLLIAGLVADTSALSTTQTKATKESVKGALGGFSLAKADAELVLGEITRGKNKGCARLECVVDGICVGILSKASESKVLARYGVSDLRGLPVPIPVEASLSSSKGSYRCTVAVGAYGLMTEIKGYAELHEARMALVRCLHGIVLGQADDADASVSSSKVVSSTPAAKSPAQSANGSGCLVFVAIPVIAAGTMLACALGAIGGT